MWINEWVLAALVVFAFAPLANRLGRWLARAINRWADRLDERTLREAMSKPGFWDGHSSEDLAISVVWGDRPCAATAKEELVRRRGHIEAAELIAAQAQQRAAFAAARALRDEVMGKAGEVA
jgi:hypothetical protein